MTDTHIKDGGPAFPASPTYGPNGDLYRPADIGCEGMTLRDWFAGQALSGSLASQTAESHWAFQALPNGIGNDTGALTGIARLSYDLADAMIAARKGGVK